MSAPRFVKLDEQGNALPADATNHIQVLDNTTDLIWTVETLGGKRVGHAAALALAAACRIGGNEDWALPAAEQLLTLVDSARYSPAIDTDAFPDTENAWYWTSTPYPGLEESCARVVKFDNGNADGARRDSNGFVRAVRSARAPSH